VTPGLERETGLRQRLSTFDSRRRFRRRVRQRLHDNATRLGSVERAVRWQERVARPLGVDMRHPLLDHRLVPAVLRMPPEAHFRAGRTKALLRRAMVGRLPESVRTRRGKTWFTEFVTAGLVGASGWIEPLLREPLVETLGFVDGNALRSSYTRSRDDGFNGLEGLFWHALTLELWLRRHLRDESSQVDDAVELGLGWR
jgi:asparagine synthase (glutamine-hydrolysing)